MLELDKRIELYGDNIGYVAKVRNSHITDLETAKKFIADVASVTRGKQVQFCI